MSLRKIDYFCRRTSRYKIVKTSTSSANLLGRPGLVNVTTSERESLIDNGPVSLSRRHHFLRIVQVMSRWASAEGIVTLLVRSTLRPVTFRRS